MGVGRGREWRELGNPAGAADERREGARCGGRDRWGAGEGGDGGWGDARGGVLKFVTCVGLTGYHQKAKQSIHKSSFDHTYTNHTRQQRGLFI